VTLERRLKVEIIPLCLLPFLPFFPKELLSLHTLRKTVRKAVGTLARPVVPVLLIIVTPQCLRGPWPPQLPLRISFPPQAAL